MANFSQWGGRASSLDGAQGPIARDGSADGCMQARASPHASQKNPPWSSKNRAPDSPANLAAAVTDFGARTFANYCVCTALVAAAANLHRRCW